MCSLEASSTVKNILFDRKITFFAITIYFAEHDHRLKIENVVVADQVLINALLLSHVDAGVIRQRHPFLYLINLSILSCRQIVDLESI